VVRPLLLFVPIFVPLGCYCSSDPLVSVVVPVAAGRGRLLDLRGAPHRHLRREGDLYAPRLEVPRLASDLHEAGRVVEVAGVAELQGRHALAGVVARVAHREARREVAALGIPLEKGIPSQFIAGP
jgi:hypothetical protein